MNCKRCHKDMQLDAPFCPWCGAKQEASKGRKTRGNGQGSVFKTGSSWTAQITIGWRVSSKTGKPYSIKRKSCGHKTKAAAIAALEGLHSNISERRIPTLFHYWEMYEKSELAALSNSKQTAYQIAWGKLKPLHYKQVDAITVFDLRTIAESTAPTYYPRKDIKTLLSHLFKLAGADGFASKDLPDYIQLPTLEEKERQPFSDLEQGALWKAYESGCKDARIPLVMIYTGMMPGEVMQLRADMIDWDERVIRGVGIKTKVRKESVVYIPDCLLPILQELCEESKRGKLFEINKDSFYAHYYAALETAGCRKLTPYSCRHTTATALAITQNIAPQTVKKIMRWSTTRMLDRYAHATNKDASDALNTLRPSTTP